MCSGYMYTPRRRPASAEGKANEGVRAAEIREDGTVERIEVA